MGFFDSYLNYSSSWARIKTLRGDREMRNEYLLYPHDSLEYVFIIFQAGKLKSMNAFTRITTPILQWLVIIAASAIVLYILRTFAQERIVRDDRLTALFIDSVAIFVGSALNKLSSNRPERVYFIFFTIFGMILKISYTGELFVMFQSHDHHRITTLNQLARQDIKFYTDLYSEAQTICIGEPV